MELHRQLKFQLINLTWERIFLKFEVKSEDANITQFVLTKLHNGTEKKEMIPLQMDKFENGVYYLSLNIAAANGRSFLENGQWKLAAMVAQDICFVGISNELGYQLETKTRIFPYGERKYAYNVFFTLTSDGNENLQMVLNSYFMRINEQWKKRNLFWEAPTLTKKCKSVVSAAVFWGIGSLYKIMASILPKNGKQILFMSESKDYLWGNLKYIDQRIKERELDKEYQLNYSFRNVFKKKSSVTSWMKMLYLLAKSDYIFIDDYAPIFAHIRLHAKTKLIQVWHAGEGFKSVGYSRFGKDGSPYPGQSSHKKYDYVTVGSRKLIPVYEEVFGIEKEAFLPTGMARLDDFMDEDNINRFKNTFYTEYPKMKNKKVILFAPTFRGTGQKEAYYDYDQLDLEQIYEFCGEEFVFLSKVHPFIKEKIQIPEKYKDRIFDFAGYPNINELYYITDLLITDYSSNYYEYALLKKPVLFFTYDREKYELIRGVHRSVKEHAPGKVCDSFEKLMDALYKKDYEFEKIEKFVEDNFAEYDGHACDRIIDQIILQTKRYECE